MQVYNGMTWDELLRGVVREYRNAHKDSALTDWQILDDFMEHLVSTGRVKKSKKGTYLVPRIGFLQ